MWYRLKDVVSLTFCSTHSLHTFPIREATEADGNNRLVTYAWCNRNITKYNNNNIPSGILQVSFRELPRRGREVAYKRASK